MNEPVASRVSTYPCFFAAVFALATMASLVGTTRGSDAEDAGNVEQ